MPIVLEVLDKDVDEFRTYGMDFAALLNTGETLSSVTSVTCTCNNVSVSTGTISGAKVFFSIGGGTINQRCTIKVTVVTSLSNILVGSGKLRITGDC